jgi:hypothetical protein
MTKSKTKWSKYKILKRDQALAKALPETTSFSEANLTKALESNRALILKPSVGSGGAGVIQVTHAENHSYQVHTGKVKYYVTKAKLYPFLHGKIKGKPYLIQQRINLIRVFTRPCDFRVMVQRKSGSDWKVTGKLAKVAGHGYIVTNIQRSRGTVLPAETALHHTKLPTKILSKMDHIALTTAKRLNTAYPSIRILGLDMGVDNEGHVWIIEANFRPALSLFKHLRDKTMYNRILSYSRPSPK